MGGVGAPAARARKLRRAAHRAGVLGGVVIIAAATMPARAESVPRVVVAGASAPIVAVPSTATNVVATCEAGTTLLSGGVLAARADPQSPTAPGNGLRAKGSYPSDPAGVPALPGTAPASWSATANFGAAAETGDQVTSLALCSPLTVTNPVVVTQAVSRPIAPNTMASVTVTCPPGMIVLGGGALSTPVGVPGLKPVGMYPSDAAGAMLAAGAANPSSWTAVGLNGGQLGSTNVTTAHAVCAEPRGLSTWVARLDAPGPQFAGRSTLTTVGCGWDALVGGGVYVDSSRGDLQIGVHLLGSYPGDLAGAPAPAGSADPDAWSAVVATGGLSALGTVAHVFAVCAYQGPPPPT